ncbi:MAG TPA: ATP-binding cassette domain-containing protein [Bacteroidia bacterium]|jgi:ABC-2 type transport system ATP-binding protein|nr:ATP-binding cassette domain-containing protein [Bacteroidia bacterium]
MDNKDNVAIEVFKMNKTFNIRDDNYNTVKQRFFHLFNPAPIRHLHALKDIHFNVYQGECIGIIGGNGSGKSTLVKCMAGVYQTTQGYVKLKGSMMLMNLGVGMSHELTARENIYVSGSALGLKISEIDKIFNEIIAFAELEEFVNTKIKYFSTGMGQRLAFSIAAHARADIMFLDEVFAVGDQKFVEKAIKVVEKSWIEGRTTVIVSHDLSIIEKYCKKVAYLKKGQLMHYGDPKTGIDLYLNDPSNHI